MNACTAIIVHPDFKLLPTALEHPGFKPRFVALEETECLELHGPRLGFSSRVHHYKGAHLPVADFVTFTNHPDFKEHPQRAPKQVDGWEIDQSQMGRVLRLLACLVPATDEGGRKLAEIRRRILTVHPYATEPLW